MKTRSQTAKSTKKMKKLKKPQKSQKQKNSNKIKTNQKSTEMSQSTPVDEFQKKVLKYDLDNNISTKEILKIKPSKEENARPISSIAKMQTFSYSDFKLKSNHHNPEEEKCPICMFEFSEDDSNKIVKLNKCEDHYFHLECIEMCHSRTHLKCPICGIIYGIMTGDMPEGTMSVIRYPPEALTLEGYPNLPCYEIIYTMNSGTRDRIQFPGTTRHAFLPCNDEGKEILRLLIIAFERKLTFTIGTSVTTGRTNQIVWNGIHHKTSVEGGPAFFGFPDDTYFLRIKEELAAKGIY